MRTLVKLFVLMCFVMQAFGAGTVTLRWDPPPVGETWQFVRIYERAGPTNAYTYTRVAEVTGALLSVMLANVSTGAHTYVARAVNGTLESANSNAVTGIVAAPVPGVPSAPRLNTTVISVTSP